MAVRDKRSCLLPLNSYGQLHPTQKHVHQVEACLSSPPRDVSLTCTRWLAGGAADQASLPPSFSISELTFEQQSFICSVPGVRRIQFLVLTQVGLETRAKGVWPHPGSPGPDPPRNVG